MWSKTRQVILGRLALSLWDRVNFVREEFTSKKLKYWSTMPIFRITVDGETWFATCCCDMWEFIPLRFMQKEPVSKNKKVYSKRGSVFWDVFGYPKIWAIDDGIHNYLNVLPLEECLKPDAGFCNILALLDYRLGKKRICKILENIDSYPDFWHKWIKLRAESEGLLLKKEEVC